MNPNIQEQIKTNDYTLRTRLRYLMSMHMRNTQNVTAFQASFLDNVLNMTEDERAQIPVNEIRQKLSDLRKAANELSTILNVTASGIKDAPSLDAPPV